MKRLFSSLAFVLALVAATPAFAQKSGGVRIEFQGPGGHSFGAYGRVSALHAAARTMILLQKALPAGSYQITNLTGGNSVNAIASDGLVELKLTAANAKAYDALVAAVKKRPKIARLPQWNPSTSRGLRPLVSAPSGGGPDVLSRSRRQSIAAIAASSTLSIQ